MICRDEVDEAPPNDLRLIQFGIGQRSERDERQRRTGGSRGRRRRRCRSLSFPWPQKPGYDRQRAADAQTGKELSPGDAAAGRRRSLAFFSRLTRQLAALLARKIVRASLAREVKRFKNSGGPVRSRRRGG